MKFLRRVKDRYLIELDAEDAILWSAVLTRFPMVPAAHHQISKEPEAAPAEAQKLLHEAMEAEKAGLRQRIEPFVRQMAKGVADDAVRLHLTAEEIDWLLRVANDVRVGTWLKLGAPEVIDRPPKSADPDAPVMWLLMEMAGVMEVFLLNVAQRAGG